MSLKTKSIHDLRVIAQSYGVPVEKLFSMDAAQLTQAIELRQQRMAPEPKPLPPRPEYDARLMTKPPSKKSAREEVEALLSGHVSAGLRLEFPEEEVWAMAWEKKTDTGSMRMPLRVILNCAERMMR